MVCAFEIDITTNWLGSVKTVNFGFVDPQSLSPIPILRGRCSTTTSDPVVSIFCTAQPLHSSATSTPSTTIESAAPTSKPFQNKTSHNMLDFLDTQAALVKGFQFALKYNDTNHPAVRFVDLYLNDHPEILTYTKFAFLLVLFNVLSLVYTLQLAVRALIWLVLLLWNVIIAAVQKFVAMSATPQNTSNPPTSRTLDGNWSAETSGRFDRSKRTKRDSDERDDGFREPKVKRQDKSAFSRG